MLEGDAELQGVKAKLLQRGLYVGKQLVLVHGLARRAPPAALWQELHAYYRLAEMLDCAVTAVSDDLTPHAVGMSCYSTYCHALLLGLADPWAMSIRQIELTDRWLSQWARKVFPYAQQRETEGPVMLLDLDGNSGATLAAAAPRDPPRSMRFGYPGKLATSVRGRLKRLAAGASPAELQLGHDASVEGCMTLLSHLDARWYQLPRRGADAEPHVARTRDRRRSGGLFPRRRPHVRPPGSARPPHVPGRPASADARRAHRLRPLSEEAERNWPWERWQGRYEWREAELDARTTTARYRWFLDQLVVVRDDERVRLGYVTRVALDPHGEFSVSLTLWPGTPQIAGGAADVAYLRRGAADAGAPAVGDAGRAGDDDRAAAHVQSRAAVPLDGSGAGAQIPPDQARPARRRFRAGRLRRVLSASPRAAVDGPDADAFAIPMTNRLADATSPYLQQHAANPVDWHPWGDEALARARAEDKPILLSIGYSACHWCHVMAHESFEDADVAAVMNEHFVNIKVDREERPDLDQIYQTAHALLTRRSGGWPLTMFLTPAGAPFFAGTYFPKQGRYGLPGFVDLLPRVAAAYREQGEQIALQNARLAEAMASFEPAGGDGALPVHAAAQALAGLKERFDPEYGGFGGAPKFPHPTELEFCLRAWGTARDDEARAVVAKSLACMADGGI